MILLMGIAGSGKGTQGKMLSDQFGYHLISMGDVVRMYVTGDQRKRMLEGVLLDDNEIISIVDKVLYSMPDDQSVVLDGFPRTIPQAEWLINESKKGRFTVDIALHLVASHRAVKERLLGRARIDDTESAIEARFNDYEKATMPLLSWLSEQGIAVANIEAERSVEDVNKDIISNLEKIKES